MPIHGRVVIRDYPWSASNVPPPKRPATLARGPHVSRHAVQVKNKDLIVPVSSWYLTDMFSRD